MSDTLCDVGGNGENVTYEAPRIGPDVTYTLFTENGAGTYGLYPKDSTSRYKRLAHQARRYIIGPMPPQRFLDTFLRKDGMSESMPSSTNAFTSLPRPQQKGPRKTRKDKGKPRTRSTAGEQAKAGKNQESELDVEDLDYEEVTVEELEEADNALAQEADADKKARRRRIKERALYWPFLRALNKRKPIPANDDDGRPRCPGFAFRDTSERADATAGTVASHKPDICCYSLPHIRALKATRSLKCSTNMGFAATFVEIKAEQDFFCDPAPDLSAEARAKHSFLFDHINAETERSQAMEALGQNIAYAAEICARQYRLFCFSVSLTGTHARMIRWDRAGAIVSEAFDLLTDIGSAYLCKFYWYYSQLSNEGQGYDLTASVATKEEEKLFRTTVQAHILSQVGALPSGAGSDHIFALDQHYISGCVAVIHLTTPSPPIDLNDGGPPEQPRDKLLVSQPLIGPSTMFGRCTRAFWAVHRKWNAASGRYVDSIAFLKDTWRYSARTFDKQEGSVLQSLCRAGVPHIPPVEVHEDVRQASLIKNAKKVVELVTHNEMQRTRTQEFASASWNSCLDQVVLLEHTHYRLILSIVGYPLARFQGSRELLMGAYDAFLALKAAAALGVIHRDISPSNIILCNIGSNNPRAGFLCDWDLARESSESRVLDDYEVSATWQFQPIAALTPPVSEVDQESHTVEHDMESMLYSVLHCALTSLPNKGGDPRICLDEMFDGVLGQFRGRKNAGGNGKTLNKTAKKFYTANITWDSPITIWLNDVMDFFAAADSRWTPIELAKYWRDFLDRYEAELPLDDRCAVLSIPKKTSDEADVPQDRIASLFLQGQPHLAPVPYNNYNAAKKRKRERQSAANSRPNKKRAIDAKDAPTHCAPSTDAPISLGLATTPVTLPPLTTTELSDNDSDASHGPSVTRLEFVVVNPSQPRSSSQ